MIVIYSISSMLILILLIFKQKNHWKENIGIQLSWKREIIICLVAIGLSVISIELHKSKSNNYRQIVIGSLSEESEQINFFDKKMVGQWNIEAKDKGKFFKNTAIYIIPISLLFFAISFKRRGVLFFVFTEGYVITESLTGIVKGLIIRYRPFSYKTSNDIEKLSKEPKEKFLEDITSYDIQNSFFSGDASITAFGFMLFALCYSIFYPDSKLKNGVYAVAIFCILLECYFRALSGKHFPSDVIIGALFGIFVSYLIVKLHRRSVG